MSKGAKAADGGLEWRRSVLSESGASGAERIWDLEPNGRNSNMGYQDLSIDLTATDVAIM